MPKTIASLDRPLPRYRDVAQIRAVWDSEVRSTTLQYPISETRPERTIANGDVVATCQAEYRSQGKSPAVIGQQHPKKIDVITFRK